MTNDEQLALAWVSRHTHLLECDRCGGRWVAGRSMVSVFHRCERSTPSHDWRTPHQRSEEERISWARRLLGDGLIEAVEQRDGVESMFREIE